MKMNKIRKRNKLPQTKLKSVYGYHCFSCSKWLLHPEIVSIWRSTGEEESMLYKSPAATAAETGTRTAKSNTKRRKVAGEAAAAARGRSKGAAAAAIAATVNGEEQEHEQRVRRAVAELLYPPCEDIRCLH